MTPGPELAASPTVGAGVGTRFGRFKPNDVFQLTFFLLCLIPINMGTLSVNYLFVLYPVWCLASGRRLRWPPRELLWALGWYCLIFVIGLVLSGADFSSRSIWSFLIFASMFSLIFFDLTQRELFLFKVAVLVAALAFAAGALFNFFLAGGNAIGFAQKDIVGSQRYGFVYLTAFFITLSKSAGVRLPTSLKALAIAILLAGMLLTFSRSTVITFVAASGLYIVATTVEKRRQLRGGAAELARRIGLVIGCLVVLALFLPLPFTFYQTQILARYIPVLEYFANAPEPVIINPAPVAVSPPAAEPQPVAPATPIDAPVIPAEEVAPSAPPSIPAEDEQLIMVEDVFNQAGSEGTRLVLWSLIVDYVNQHPILGSRYMGIWTLEGAPSGSAHNQLFDVLLRTGWPGLAIYVLLLARLLVGLYRVDRALFWGLVATLIFGTFHETFKESQGAFILAFLLGVLATTAKAGLLSLSHAPLPENPDRWGRQSA